VLRLFRRFVEGTEPDRVLFERAFKVSHEGACLTVRGGDVLNDILRREPRLCAERDT
jgi:hypothetical protein